MQHKLCLHKYIRKGQVNSQELVGKILLQYQVCFCSRVWYPLLIFTIHLITNHLFPARGFKHVPLISALLSCEWASYHNFGLPTPNFVNYYLSALFILNSRYHVKDKPV